MEPKTIVCRKCGHTYIAYIYECAVCPKCITPEDGIIDDESFDD